MISFQFNASRGGLRVFTTARYRQGAAPQMSIRGPKGAVVTESVFVSTAMGGGGSLAGQTANAGEVHLQSCYSALSPF